jgi:transposase
MAKPYSLDLRRRVVAAVDAGESCRTAAKRFCVSVSAVVKWSQRARLTGSPAPAPMGGRRPFALAGERDWVLSRLAAAPDITLRALAAELADRGVKVSVMAVWTFCRREGFTFKKKPARRRAGSPRRGAQARALASPSRAP